MSLNKFFIFSLLISLLTGSLASFAGGSVPKSKIEKLPNIIYVFADDLGYQELGCYGQKYIKTPHIDKIAQEGIRFTQHYSGNPICAPSRCVLMTGKHNGHAYFRNNSKEIHLPEGTFTIAKMLKSKGYKTACIGKWGLGLENTSGHPNKQGFDFFYGYLNQSHAHQYYPTYLWKNNQRDSLDNPFFRPHQRFPLDKDPFNPADYAQYQGKEYSTDKMGEEAIGFIERNQESPFFLYLPFTTPHACLQVPASTLNKYSFPEIPYAPRKGKPEGIPYLPHYAPRAAYAAMITHMDMWVGRIMDKVKELGMDDNTLIIFSSDNGTTFNGGVDRFFFNSLGELRGRKGNMYEGGIRVPMVARWPTYIEPGSVTDHLSGIVDIVPTFAELTGISLPDDELFDGISLLPTLLGKGKQQQHDFLYWELGSIKSVFRQGVRMGNYKGVRTINMSPFASTFELFDLSVDISEAHNIASQNPVLVDKIKKIMNESHTKPVSEMWEIPKAE